MKAVLPGVLLISIGMVVLVAHTNAIQNHGSGIIDKTIIREVDLTRDGKPEKIVLHITGKDFKSPFKWTIEIYSQGRRIFYKKGDDSTIDANFNNPDYVGDCANYEACKEKWYFKDMMDAFLIPLSPEFSDVLESMGGSSFNEIKDRILQTRNADLHKAKEVIEALKEQIKSGKAIAIALEVNPGYAGSLGLWVPIVNDFVRIYN
jgi:hypothetical protein